MAEFIEDTKNKNEDPSISIVSDGKSSNGKGWICRKYQNITFFFVILNMSCCNGIF